MDIKDMFKGLDEKMVTRGLSIAEVFTLALLEHLKSVADEDEPLFYGFVGGAVASALNGIERNMQVEGASNAFIAGFTSFREYAERGGCDDSGDSGDSENRFDKIFSNN